MAIQLRPDLEEILQAQVDLGNFPTLEAALEAAVMALPGASADDLPAEGFSWFKPYLDEVDKAIVEGRAQAHEAVWAALGKRLGKN